MRLRGFCPVNIVLWGEIIGKEEVGRDKVLPGKRVRWCRELHSLVM